MILQKFGGTSVGDAKRMQNIISLIQSEEARIVVLSAVSGTTNKLLEIAESLYLQQKPETSLKIKALEAEYFALADELFETYAKKEESKKLIGAHFTYLH